MARKIADKHDGMVTSPQAPGGFWIVVAVVLTFTPGAAWVVFLRRRD